VATLARDELGDALRGFEDGVDDPQCHVLVTRIDPRLRNLHAPNGGEVGLDKHEHQLVWYRRLRETRGDPALPLVLRGDLSVAPEDRDVWDPERRRGQTLCREPERAAFRTLVTWSLRDALRF
jgi:exodeoxyribonuclease-3